MTTKVFRDEVLAAIEEMRALASTYTFPDYDAICTTLRCWIEALPHDEGEVERRKLPKSKCPACGKKVAVHGGVLRRHDNQSRVYCWGSYEVARPALTTKQEKP